VVSRRAHRDTLSITAGGLGICGSGGQLHGPYNPEGDAADIAEDFLTFCLLAVRKGALPKRWDWAAFLQVAKRFVVCVVCPAPTQRERAQKHIHSEGPNNPADVRVGSVVKVLGPLHNAMGGCEQRDM
jgi:hypothetical protein